MQQNSSCKWNQVIVPLSATCFTFIFVYLYEIFEIKNKWYSSMLLSSCVAVSWILACSNRYGVWWTYSKQQYKCTVYSNILLEKVYKKPVLANANNMAKTHNRISCPVTRMTQLLKQTYRSHTVLLCISIHQWLTVKTMNTGYCGITYSFSVIYGIEIKTSVNDWEHTCIQIKMHNFWQ